MSDSGRGKLKLKKPITSPTGKIEKKKKKDKKSRIKKKEKAQPEKQEPQQEDPLAWMTPSERAYELAQQERKRKRLEKKAELSHAEKIRQLNSYLSKLSEHYDIPKVRPG
eukprot:TRINITY_DN28000_c0_g1_i1.p1 TRINITY_DN28000_c0_g1~~TRINITY_DN28000_c0_g1_i1.p1  ORF type:complete len:110 (-),score=27.30 TRINITY_DN28000_c0_g1_i1:60-389(-)